MIAAPQLLVQLVDLGHVHEVRTNMESIFNTDETMETLLGC